jgi:hypothetical protein
MFNATARFCGGLGPFTPILLLLITACGSMQTDQQNLSVSAPAADLATVYLDRTHNSPGAAVGVDIKDNSVDIGTLQDGSYFVYHTNPGQHCLTATTDTALTQSFNSQPGATYYIEAGVVPSEHIFKPSLTVVFDLRGQAAIANLKRLPHLVIINQLYISEASYWGA